LVLGSCSRCLFSARVFIIRRWLGFRIELLGSIIVLVASVLVITLNNTLKIDAGLVGLLILWSSNFTVTLGFLVDTVAETEAAITAIERVDAMSRLPQEKAMITDYSIVSVNDAWPEHGHLEFKSVCLRYRKNLPLALNGLSFDVPAGKKCGIVGRSGAGKVRLRLSWCHLCKLAQMNYSFFPYLIHVFLFVIVSHH
jgi:ABC-type multidrug transport system fused ATPase/permease subunit